MIYAPFTHLKTTVLSLKTLLYLGIWVFETFYDFGNFFVQELNFIFH